MTHNTLDHSFGLLESTSQLLFVLWLVGLTSLWFDDTVVNSVEKPRNGLFQLLLDGLLQENRIGPRRSQRSSEHHLLHAKGKRCLLLLGEGWRFIIVQPLALMRRALGLRRQQPTTSSIWCWRGPLGATTDHRKR